MIKQEKSITEEKTLAKLVWNMHAIYDRAIKWFVKKK